MKMKLSLAILMLVAVALVGFAYFHSKSVDRAHLVNACSALLSAQQRLQQHGVVTANTGQYRVYPFTNQVTVDGAVFVCALAADLPGLTNSGTLAMTTDQIFIWIDRRHGASIVRGQDQRLVIPRGFNDF